MVYVDSVMSRLSQRLREWMAWAQGIVESAKDGRIGRLEYHIDAADGMRRAAKRDSNEPEIIDALGAIGVRVQQLSQSGVPDLLCGAYGRIWLVEVKEPDGRFTHAQKEWHKEWAGLPIYVATTIDDAIAIARAQK